MIVPIVYTVVFLLTFFVVSVVVSRCSPWDDLTHPETFFLLAGYALMWPIMVPLTVAIFFLFGIAKLVEKLIGGVK